MTWCQSSFPSPPHPGHEFSADFPATAKSTYRQMLHIFAHLFYAHYAVVLHSSLEAHFNSLFAHFIAFGTEFGLLVRCVFFLLSTLGYLWQSYQCMHFKIQDPKDLFSPTGSQLGIGELVDVWREMNIIA